MNKYLKQRKNEILKFKSRKKRQKFMIEFKQVNLKDFPFYLKRLDHSSRKVLKGTPLMMFHVSKDIKKTISSIVDNFSKLMAEFQENRKAIKEAMLKEDTEKLSELLQQKARTSLAINGVFGNGKRLYQGLPILVTKRGSRITPEPLLKGIYYGHQISR